MSFPFGLGLVSTLSVATAQADSNVNATLGGNVSATDNAFASATGGKQADVFAQLRPGLLFGYETPRATYTALVEAEALDYLDHSDQASITARTVLRAAFQTTQTSSVELSANASTGKINALAGRATPEQTTGQVVPLGSGTIYQAGGGEVYSNELSRTVRFAQTLTGSIAETDIGTATTRTTQGGVTGTLAKAVEGHAFSVTLGATVVRYLQYDAGNAATGTPMTGRLDKQVVPSAVMAWRHDLNRTWSTGLGVGLSVLVPFGDDPYNPTRMLGTAAVAPIANASLNYVDDWGFANLVLTHQTSPNAFVAQNSTTDSAAASAVIPLAWVESHGRPPRFTASGAASIFRTTLLDTNTNQGLGTFVGEHADVGVSYVPRPSQTYGLRYSLVHQGAYGATPSLTTNTISLTFALRWPEKVAVPPRKTESVRADGSDRAPIGSGTADDDGGAKPDDDARAR